MKFSYRYILLMSIFTSLLPITLFPQEEEVKSRRETMRNIIKYGIDSQVIETLATLQEAKDDSLAEEVKELFSNTYNPKLQKTIIDYFTVIELENAEELVLPLLQDTEDKSVDLLRSALNYVSEAIEEPEEESLSTLRSLTKHSSTIVAAQAVRILGKQGGGETAAYLIDLYNERGVSLDVRSSIILALGDLEAKGAVDMLITILTDEIEEDILRRYACDSLGKIGDERALPHIRSVLGSNDAYLRAYAVSAISHFQGQEVEEILMQALRDSFWRVRISALESLADTKHAEAIPAMKFKAKHDPEKNVRLQAVESLADIDMTEAWSFLEESFKDQSVSFELRIASAEQLIKKHLDQSLASIKEVLKTEMEKKNSNLLKYTAKLLVDAKSDGLKDIYLNLLRYQDYQVQIYAVWGIEKNGFAGLVPKLEEIIEGAYHPSVKGIAKSAIETLE